MKNSRLTAATLCLAVSTGLAPAAHATGTTTAPVVRTTTPDYASEPSAVHTSPASETVPQPHSEESVSTYQRTPVSFVVDKIMDWVKKSGKFDSLKNAVKKGFSSVKNWLLTTLPNFLKDLAVEIGIDLVVEAIMNLF